MKLLPQRREGAGHRLQGRRALLRAQRLPRGAPALRGRSSRRYPKNEVAKFATNLIVESFLIDKDWASVEEVSARLAANKDVIDPKSELYKDLVKFKLAGRFKLADELMADGEYDEAAKKYIQLVDEEPKHEFADKALNNAAVCYENSRRFDSALKLYERIFREYPNSQARRRRAVPRRGQRGELLRLRQGRRAATRSW